MTLDFDESLNCNSRASELEWTEMLNEMSKVVEDSARGGFYLTLGNVASMIVSMLSVFIVARVLGSEQYGLYTISTVMPSLLVLFTNPGVVEGLTKFSANLRVKGEKGRLGRLLLRSLYFETILGLIASFACFFFAGHFATHVLSRPDISGFIQIAAALVVLQAVFDTFNSAFIGVDRAEYTAITTIVQSIIKAIVGPALVILGLAIAGALIGYVFSFIVACVLGLSLFAFKIYKALNRSSDAPSGFSKDLKMLIGYGFPLYISTLIVGFTLQYRNILLAVFTSNYEIGNFQAAMNFTVFVSSLSIPIAKILLPAFSKLEERQEDVRSFFKIAVKYTTIVVLPIVILLMTYAEEIVQVVYGEGFELAPTFFLLYALTYLFMGIGSLVIRSFFNGLGKTKENLKMSLISAVILVAMAPVLTPFVGIYGMILALILASLLSTLYGLYTAIKLFSIRVDARITMLIYLASIVSAVPLVLLRGLPLHSNLVRILVGMTIYVAIYLLVIPLTRVISSPEMQEIKKVVGRIGLLKYFASPIIYFEEKILAKIS